MHLHPRPGHCQREQRRRTERRDGSSLVQCLIGRLAGWRSARRAGATPIGAGAAIPAANPIQSRRRRARRTSPTCPRLPRPSSPSAAAAVSCHPNRGIHRLHRQREPRLCLEHGGEADSIGSSVAFSVAWLRRQRGCVPYRRASAFITHSQQQTAHDACNSLRASATPKQPPLESRRAPPSTVSSRGSSSSGRRACP